MNPCRKWLKGNSWPKVIISVMFDAVPSPLSSPAPCSQPSMTTNLRERHFVHFRLCFKNRWEQSPKKSEVSEMADKSHVFGGIHLPTAPSSLFAEGCSSSISSHRLAAFQLQVQQQNSPTTFPSSVMGGCPDSEDSEN